MKRSVFVSYVLFLTIGFSWFYTATREHFRRPDEYLKKIKILNETVAVEKLRHFRSRYEFMEFRNYVASLLPSAIQQTGEGEKSYPLRGLASLVQSKPNEKLIFNLASVKFEDGKILFRSQKYEDSNQFFSKYIRDYPYSPHIVEAFFLLSEGYYLTRQWDDCARVVNKMIELFPADETTGYAMLRVGKIYEHQERHEEAIQIYETVVKSFPARGIATAATASLRDASQ
jgi:TolA-binding protein